MVHFHFEDANHRKRGGLFLELQAQGYPSSYELVKQAVRPLRAQQCD